MRQGITPTRRWLIEAGLAWGLLAILVLGVDPGRLSRPVALLLVVGPLCGCLASLALLWAIRRDPRDLALYRRRSYLCASGLCAVFVLRTLHLLTLPGIVLCCLIAAGLLLRLRVRRGDVRPASAQYNAAPKPVATLPMLAIPLVPPASQIVRRIGRGSN